MINKLFALLAICIFLSACGIAKTNQIMTSWVGKTQNELIGEWGAPDKVYEDGSNKVLVYSETRHGSMPGTAVAMPLGSGAYVVQGYGGGPTQYQAKRTFWIKDGVITKTAWKGI